eukprot:20980-Pleurochrysis_carterae.AAC.1
MDNARMVVVLWVKCLVKSSSTVISWAAWTQQSSEVVQALDLSRCTLDVNRTRLKRKTRAET